jgi:hypothetical protein
MASSLNGTGVAFSDSTTMITGKQAVKAWIIFNGGTPAITNQYNVSTLTRTGTGQFKLTFTTAMPNANYVVAGVVNDNQGILATYLSTQTTTDCYVNTWAIGNNYNFSMTQVIVCGN